MGIGSILQHLLDIRQTNINELSIQTGVAASTIYSMVRRDSKKASIDDLYKIAVALNVPLEYFYDPSKCVPTEPIAAQPPHYADLLDKYRAIVDATSAEAYQQQLADQCADVADNVIEIDKRRVALYDVRPSAGRGNFLDESPHTIVEIGPEAPLQTSYLLTCGGDSMEPKLHDGDLLYIKEQDFVEDGEIGIFVYDDNVYVKQWECHGNGCRLVSLNPAYKPIKITQECYCLGKVLN